VQVNPVALRTIRELAGFSQAELSRRSGISQGHISQIERGHKQPRPATLRTLADVLGVPLGSLIGATDASTARPDIPADCPGLPLPPPLS
jgi:transcriptional regulator with XRE-family HTH domain